MRNAFRILLLLALPALSARAESEFQYKVPDGWANLVSSPSSVDNVPQTVKTDAASGKYAVWAVDPTRSTQQGVPVSLNVIEGAVTGTVQLAAVRNGAVAMQKHLAGMGATVTLDEVKVIKLNGVDIGYVNSLIESHDGSMRMLQYMIPGKTKVAVMTYICPVEDYDHYKPIFESSAMATRGAYDHRSFGSPFEGFANGFGTGFSWNRIWISGGVAAVLAMIVLLINYRSAARKL